MTEDISAKKQSTKPVSGWCPIGSLSLHTLNYEQDQCIWCGPDGLAWKPGRWVDTGNGFNAWSVEKENL